jgi:hypothetical protein
MAIFIGQLRLNFILAALSQTLGSMSSAGSRETAAAHRDRHRRVAPQWGGRYNPPSQNDSFRR